MKLFIINGPNLDMLGIREPEIYGKESYADLERYLHSTAEELGLRSRYSNPTTRARSLMKFTAHILRKRTASSSMPAATPTPAWR